MIGFVSVDDTNVGNGDDGTDGLTSVEKLVFADMTLDLGDSVQLFNSGGGLIGTFDTISAAVDAAGSVVGAVTILVGDGNYVENVIIDRIDVTLVSVNGRDATTITGVAGRRARHYRARPAGNKGHHRRHQPGFTVIVGIDNRAIENAAVYLQGAHDSIAILGNEVVANGDGGLRADFGIRSPTWTSTSISSPARPSPRQPGGTGFGSSSTPANVPRQLSPSAGQRGRIGSNVAFTNDQVTGTAGGISSTTSNPLWQQPGDDRRPRLDHLGNSFTGYTTGTGYALRARSLHTHITNNSIEDGAASSHGILVNNDGVPGTYSGNSFTGDTAGIVVFSMTDGADTVTGTNQADIIATNGGGDTIDALDGNDTIVGGTGGDDIDGGSGTDTSVYAGTISGFSYTVVTAPSGMVTGFTSVTQGGDVDTLASIEILQFTDVTLDTTDPVQLFDDGGTLVGTFDTIQAAVDAAGDTILIAEAPMSSRSSSTISTISPSWPSRARRSPSRRRPTSSRPTAPRPTARPTVSSPSRTASTSSSTMSTLTATVAATRSTKAAAPAGQFLRHLLPQRLGHLNDVDITGVRDPYPGGTEPGGEPIVSGVQRGVGLQVDNDSLMAFTDDRRFDQRFPEERDSLLPGRSRRQWRHHHRWRRAGDQCPERVPGRQSTGSISGNTITGIGYAGPADAYSGAILGFDNVDLDIIGNDIIGSNEDELAAKVVGIFIFDSSGGEISGNSLSHVDTGIGVYGDLQPNPIVIENNSFANLDTTDPFFAGIDLEPDAGVNTVFDVDGSPENDILFGANGADTLSGLGGDDLLRGAGNDDALFGGADHDTAEYSGDRAGYTIATLTDGNGLVTGFVSVDDDNAGDGDDGFDSLDSVEALAFDNVTLDLGQNVQLFDAGDQLVGTFDTIQDAIDAAWDGYTVRAAAGTYAEDLIVDKDVTIAGANAGLAGTDLGRGPETLITGGVNVTANGVTIDGVKISGSVDVPGSSWPAGVYVAGNNLTLSNSVLDGPTASVNGEGNNSAILTQQVTGLEVADNLFSGYAIGAYISGGGSTGSIHDNLFQGDGGPITGLGNGVNSETAGVDIADNMFDGLYAGVLNLLPQSPDNVDLNDFVTGNIFTNNAAERPIQIYPSAGTHNVIGTNENEAFVGDWGLAGPLSFEGNGGDDRAWGSAQADSFDGGSGTDQLFGNGGDDTLEGGIGDDWLDGDSGTDTAVYGGAATIGHTATNWTVTDAGGTDTLTDVEIVDDSAAGKTLLVGLGGFDTIQAAIDAASDGDTILVAAGTYDEDLTIDVGVTILGAEHGNAVGGSGCRDRRRRDDDHRSCRGHRFERRHPRRPALPQRCHHHRRRQHQPDAADPVGRPHGHQLDLLVDRRRRRQRRRRPRDHGATRSSAVRSRSPTI